MVDRIRQIIQVRQLSPTQFADAIGVARPIISHILSGRNKPSLEVVQKIIAAFPDVAMPWLLTGQGPMLASEPPKGSAVEAAAPPKAEPVPVPVSAARAPKAPKSTPTAVAEVEAPQPVLEAAATPPSRPAPEESKVAIVEAPKPSPAELPKAASTTTTATNAHFPDLPANLPLQPKIIRRVLVFYSDGTFTDFSPAADPF